MSTLRITIASRNTALAIAVPNSLIPRSLPKANDTKTATMTAAAAVMTRPVFETPSRTAALASASTCTSRQRHHDSTAPSVGLPRWAITPL